MIVRGAASGFVPNRVDRVCPPGTRQRAGLGTRYCGTPYATSRGPLRRCLGIVLPSCGTRDAAGCAAVRPPDRRRPRGRTSVADHQSKAHRSRPDILLRTRSSDLIDLPHRRCRSDRECRGRQAGARAAPGLRLQGVTGIFFMALQVMPRGSQAIPGVEQCPCPASSDAHSTQPSVQRAQARF